MLNQYNHNLIQHEFRAALAATEQAPVGEADGVVVLSAQEFQTTDGGRTLNPEIAENAENIARIQTAIGITREVAAHRAGKTVKDLSADDMRLAPTLTLNGTTTQLPYMEKIAAELGPDIKTETIDCGPAGKANTKTQFEVMAGKLAGNITVVTSDYHAPRVRRTANNFQDGSVAFNVAHVLHGEHPGYNVTSRVLGEVRRIGAYAAKGDISLHA